MTGIYDERAARKAYVRHRQTAVFTFTIMGMVIALIAACVCRFAQQVWIFVKVCKSVVFTARYALMPATVLWINRAGNAV